MGKSCECAGVIQDKKDNLIEINNKKKKSMKTKTKKVKNTITEKYNSSKSCSPSSKISHKKKTKKLQKQEKCLNSASSFNLLGLHICKEKNCCLIHHDGQILDK